MNKKLYVGGVSYQTSQEALQEAFAKAGAVESAVIMMDKFSGRSRGFGFVEMATEEDAQKAIEMWNGQELDGRTLTVNEARPPREGGAGRGPRRDSGRGGRW